MSSLATLDYLRKLTESEVKYGFIYVDNEAFRNAIKESRIKVMTPSGSYYLKIDKHKRLGKSRPMFLHNNLRCGDTISLSLTDKIIILSKK